MLADMIGKHLAGDDLPGSIYLSAEMADDAQAKAVGQ